jgi:hypothetical protein
LNHTLPSIRENLIAPIKESGYAVDILLHTYSDVAHLTNPRTGEDSDLNLEEWKLLEPDDAVLSSQEQFLDSIR